MTKESVKKITAFSMEQVRNLDAYCENALEKEVLYLTAFDTDRLLAGFRETAGLDTKGALRYEGWEVMLIGGHTMGHYLSAVAQACVNPQVSSEDRDRLYELLKDCVDGLLECQINSKGHPGFVFGAAILDKDNVELQFDYIEKGKTNIITEAWVPFYTLHKILAGLMDTYNLTGYEPALTVAKGIGDWTYNRQNTWDDKTRQTVIGIEFGGMNDALYELYKATGTDRYAIAAHRFDPDNLFMMVESGAENALNNLHANTTIPKFMGALNRYVATHGKTVEGECVDASRYLIYAEKFWEMVVMRHTYITGGNSEWEHFGVDYILDGERTNCNCETCNIYNMLKLSRTLFEITGDKKYADYYENAYINTILSSQNPETGMTTYFQPMANGFFKVYGEKWNKFWCCTGTGMENFTKLNDSIFFHDDNTVFVNLYENADLDWEEKGLTLKMRGNLLSENKIAITMSSDKPVNLALRLPAWLSDSAEITLDGCAYNYETVSGYALISGEKINKKEICIVLPMKIVAVPLPDNDKCVGFKYGPYVLSADLGCENLVTTTTGVNVTIPKEKVRGMDNISLPEDVSSEEFIKNAGDYFDRQDESFVLTHRNLKFAPHYLRYRERYGLYFTIGEEETKRPERNVVDVVQPGYGQYENDELHQLKDEGSVGSTERGTTRYAIKGGRFTYRMAMKMGATNGLLLTLLKEDNGKSIRIAVGDRVIFEERLNFTGDAQSSQVLVRFPWDIPGKAVKTVANGEEYFVIPITISGIDGEESARVADFIYMLEL